MDAAGALVGVREVGLVVDVVGWDGEGGGEGERERSRLGIGVEVGKGDIVKAIGSLGIDERRWYRAVGSTRNVGVYAVVTGKHSQPIAMP